MIQRSINMASITHKKSHSFSGAVFITGDIGAFNLSWLLTRHGAEFRPPDDLQ